MKYLKYVKYIVLLALCAFFPSIIPFLLGSMVFAFVYERYFRKAR